MAIGITMKTIIISDEIKKIINEIPEKTKDEIIAFMVLYYGKGKFDFNKSLFQSDMTFCLLDKLKEYNLPIIFKEDA